MSSLLLTQDSGESISFSSPSTTLVFLPFALAMLVTFFLIPVHHPSLKGSALDDISRKKTLLITKSHFF